MVSQGFHRSWGGYGGGVYGQWEGKLEQKAVNGAWWGGKLLSAATLLPPHPPADGLSWCPPAFLASSAVPPPG